jgi:hypothetical protein
VSKKAGQALEYTGQTYPGKFFAGFSSQPITVLDRWRKPGDFAKIQKFTTQSNISYLLQSDAQFQDITFARVKNISLSYDITASLIRKIRLSGCRFYLHAQNVLTISNYQGLDPENAGSNRLPPLRMITTGLKLVL